MRTQAQAGAARKNGAKSRGPKTPEGKAASSRNAVRHGMTAKNTLLTAENSRAFQELAKALYDKFQPADEYERHIVDQIVVYTWHERRDWSHNAAMFELEMTRMSKEVDAKYEKIDYACRYALAFKSLADNSNSLQLYTRYETNHRRAGQKAVAALLQLRRNGVKPPAPPDPPASQTEPPAPPAAPTANHNSCETNPANPDSRDTLPVEPDPCAQPEPPLQTPAPQQFAGTPALASDPDPAITTAPFHDDNSCETNPGIPCPRTGPRIHRHHPPAPTLAREPNPAITTTPIHNNHSSETPPRIPCPRTGPRVRRHCPPAPTLRLEPNPAITTTTIHDDNSCETNPPIPRPRTGSRIHRHHPPAPTHGCSTARRPARCTMRSRNRGRGRPSPPRSPGEYPPRQNVAQSRHDAALLDMREQTHGS